jgi:hypothetical protein
MIFMSGGDQIPVMMVCEAITYDHDTLGSAWWLGQIYEESRGRQFHSRSVDRFPTSKVR